LNSAYCFLFSIVVRVDLAVPKKQKRGISVVGRETMTNEDESAGRSQTGDRNGRSARGVRMDDGRGG
jgi:hypothetical protein